jgi:hypothetical protein
MSDAGDISETGRLSDSRVGADTARAFAALLADMSSCAAPWYGARQEARDTRLQQWPGQSPDGKQHSADLGHAPYTFEGGSDQRILWADGIIRERVRLACVALSRASVSVAPKGRVRPDTAWEAERMLADFMAGSNLKQAAELAATYTAADSPALALLTCRFVRERELEEAELDAAALADAYIRLSEEVGVDPAAARIQAQAFAEALSGDGGERELADALLASFDISERDALKAVRAVRAQGSVRLPVPGPWRERLEFRALRFGDDFLIPSGTMDFARAPLWFEQERLAAADLRARAAAEEWDESFLQAVLEHPADAWCFPEHPAEAERFPCGPAEAEHYRVVTVHYQTAGADGTAARWRSVIHPADPEATAYGRRLDADSCAVLLCGETFDQWAVTARGVCDVAGPVCGVAKGMRDDSADAGRLCALPPVVGEGYGSGREETVPLDPLGYLPVRRGGRLAFLSGIQYPAHLVQALKDLRFDLDEYYARPVDGVPRAVADAAQEHEVSRFLGGVERLLHGALRLILGRAAAETLAPVGGREPLLLGGFAVRVAFDATTLDEDRTIAKFSALSALKAGDADNVLDMTPLIKAGVRALFPHHAAEALRPSDAGALDEDESELRNYLSIRAGIMPRMSADGGWNYARRLQWYEQKMAENPAIFDDMAPAPRQMLDNWLKAMQQQATQFGANREIGRTGAEGVES